MLVVCVVCNFYGRWFRQYEVKVWKYWFGNIYAIWKWIFQLATSGLQFSSILMNYELNNWQFLNEELKFPYVMTGLVSINPVPILFISWICEWNWFLLRETSLIAMSSASDYSVHIIQPLILQSLVMKLNNIPSMPSLSIWFPYLQENEETLSFWLLRLIVNPRRK